MGIYYNYFIFDDHLGLLNGRTARQEADHIKKILAAKGVSFFNEPRYIVEANCICFESNRSPEVVRETLHYDGMYYKQEGCSELIRLYHQQPNEQSGGEK